MAFTLATSAKGGSRAGLATALGVGAGALVWAAVTAAGLAALLAASAHALTVIRLAGGAYLIYLAYRTFRHRGAELEAAGARRMSAAFRSGALTNLLNPKVGLFYLAFLPGFTEPSAGPVWLQIFVLGAIFSLSGAGVLAIVALIAGRVRGRLAQSRSLRVRLNTLSAGVFGSLGAYLILSKNNV